MGYFTETMALLEKGYSIADGIADSSSAMAGSLWSQCFSTSKYLTYKSRKNDKSYTGAAAFNQAYSDYCNKAASKESGIKKISASMKAGDRAMELCKAANKKEEYNLNKILGI